MIEEIKTMLLAGMTGGQIAEALGMTRGQIAGLVHRNGLAQYRQRIPKPKSKPTPIRMVKINRKPPRLDVTAFDVSNGERLAVLHLSDKTCRWPHGHPKEPDFHFCGLTPRPGSPYCEVHHSRAYVENSGW